MCREYRDKEQASKQARREGGTYSNGGPSTDVNSSCLRFKKDKRRSEMSDIWIAAQSFSRMAAAQLVYTVLYLTGTRSC